MGELLDGALGLIRSNPRTVLGLAAAISAVVAVLQTAAALLALAVLPDPFAEPTTGPDELTDLSAVATASLAQLVPGVIAGFLQVLASGLFIVLVAAAVLGRRLDAPHTWLLLRPRLPALVGLTLLLVLAGLGAVGALAAVVVILVGALGTWGVLPGLGLGAAGLVVILWAYVRLSLAAPAVVVESRSPMAALQRSWRLVAGSWWRVAGILLLAAVITNLLTVVVSVPMTTIAMLVTTASESLVAPVVASGLTTLLAGVVVLPFTAAVTGLLYTDLRMRRESLDIDLARAAEPQPDPLAPFRGRPGQ